MTFLIFIYPTSIELANKYNRVFILNYTYKINRFKILLLYIISVILLNYDSTS